MLTFLLVFVLLVRLSLQFSPHSAVTKVTKLNAGYSPRVKVQWYFPEFGFGDYSDTMRVYSCRHSGEPNKFIYEYRLALTMKPEFSRIYFAAYVDDVPEGHACMQVCAAFDNLIEKCSDPFLFENSYSNKTLPKSYPVFWNQNKQFKSYPYILRVSPAGAETSVEWYFPRYQAYTYTNTLLYSCRFNPSDLSISHLQLVKRYGTEHKSVHRAQLPPQTHRWLCVRVCVLSHYQVCGDVARYDNQAIHSTSAPTAAPTLSTDKVATSQKQKQEGEGEAGGGGINYDLIFDDYEDLDSLFEESRAGMTSFKEDVFIGGDNTTNSGAYKFSPSLFFTFLFLLVV